MDYFKQKSIEKDMIEDFKKFLDALLEDDLSKHEFDFISREFAITLGYFTNKRKYIADGKKTCGEKP